MDVSGLLPGAVHICCDSEISGNLVFLIATFQTRIFIKMPYVSLPALRQTGSKQFNTLLILYKNYFQVIHSIAKPCVSSADDSKGKKIDVNFKAPTVRVEGVRESRRRRSQSLARCKVRCLR
jgi:hypothetical protein